jgi:hypothetical protein
MREAIDSDETYASRSDDNECKKSEPCCCCPRISSHKCLDCTSFRAMTSSGFI